MATLCTKFLLSTRIIRPLSITQRYFRQLRYSASVLPSKVQNFAISGENHTKLAQFHTTSLLLDEEEGDEEEEGEKKKIKQRFYQYEPTDVDTSIRYMKSKAYDITYRGEHVWVPYRRNHKGRLPPMRTRKTCVRGGYISTGNPCPICRDEYLALHPKHIDLLKQFISPISGDIISYTKTGLCQKQHKALTIAILQAWDLGYLERPLPFREYNYSDYYPQLAEKSQ